MLRALSLFLIYLFSPFLEAVLLVYSEAFEENPTKREQAATLLRTYAGPGTFCLLEVPSPSMERNKTEHTHFEEIMATIAPSLEEKPDAETSFIKRIFVEEMGVEVCALSIPTTVWDLYAIYCALKGKIPRDALCLRKTEAKTKKNAATYYFELCRKLLKKIPLLKEEPNASFYVRLARNILRKFHRIPGISPGQDFERVGRDWYSGNDAFDLENVLSFSSKITALQKCFEVLSLHHFQNLLLQMVRMEFDAIQRNHILWVRHTNGCIYEDSRGDYGSPFVPALDWLLRENLSYSPGSLDAKIKEALSHGEFSRCFDLLNTGNCLCFGASLLAGFLRDGIDAVGPACSFVRLVTEPFKGAKKAPSFDGDNEEPAIEERDYLYAVSFPKRFLVSEYGPFLFHVERGSLPGAGVFGKGEFFHPIMRAMRPSPPLLQENIVHHRVLFSHKAREECPYDLGSLDTCLREAPPEKRQEIVLFLYHTLMSARFLADAHILTINGNLVSEDPALQRQAREIETGQKLMLERFEAFFLALLRESLPTTL